jgi:acetolactate synthase-1/2/3 large subunit
VRLGTPCVFGIPGEGASLELLIQLENLGCAFHLVPHEAAGALMAGGFGRVSGIPGVSLSIKGPGLSNMISGIATNWLDHNPTLSLSESYGPGSNPHRMHKRLAHAPMLANVVKAYADNISPYLVEDLWNLSMAEEPGPVHLDISGCMKGQSFDKYTIESDERSDTSAEAARLISRSQRPVAVIGALATRRKWRRALAQLKFPIFTTVAGKGAVDETLPYVAGVFTNSGGLRSPESRLLPMADLVVGLGLRTTEILDVKQLPAPLVLFDEMGGKASGLKAACEVCLDCDRMLEVFDLLSSKHWGEVEISAANDALIMQLEFDRWLPAGALRLTQQILPASTRFILDTGNFCTIAEHTLIARTPLDIIGSACGRAMGVALPTGVGATLASRDTPSVTIVGDGGIGMYPEVIRLAVEEKLPQLVLMMRDGFLSSVRKEARKKNASGEFLRVPGTSWTGTFQSFGCAAERVDSLKALEGALTDWDLDSGPLFLELVFDADTYMLMTDGIR